MGRTLFNGARSLVCLHSGSMGRFDLVLGGSLLSRLFSAVNTLILGKS
jgi:hypothetical protein